MKLSYQNKIATALLLAALTSSAALFAQESTKKENPKVHITIVTEENGKTKTLDTTFAKEDKEALNNFLREHDMEMPSAPEPPTPPELGDLPVPPSPPEPPAFDEHMFAFSFDDSEMTALGKKMEGLSERMAEMGEKMSKEFEEKFGKDFQEKMQKFEEQMKEYEGKMQDRMKELDKKDMQPGKKTYKKMMFLPGDDKDGKNIKKVMIISPEGKTESNVRCAYAYKFKCNGDSLGENKIFRTGDKNTKIFIVTDQDPSKPGQEKKITRKIIIDDVNGEIEKATKEAGKEKEAELKNEEKALAPATEEQPVTAEIKKSTEPASSYTLNVNDLKFSPNPNNGQFNLSFTLPTEGKTEVKILDVAGQEVFSETLENFSGEYHRDIDITGQAKGTYLLQVRQGDQWMHKKVVVR